LAVALFGFLRRKRERPKDPLAAFDALLEQLERQASQVRKSAAALLTARSELVRIRERQDGQLEDLRARLGAVSDAKATEILTRDRQLLESTAAESERALHKASADAEILLELAKELGDQSAALQKERASARVQLEAERAFSAAIAQKSARIERLLAVDAARDEIERAHALAQIVREDAGIKAR
jgi:hypothetical protein